MSPDPSVVHGTAELQPGVRLRYVAAGDGPRTIVLLHGFPQTWWEWRHVIAPLADEGWRVIAPDYSGAGASSKPPASNSIALSIETARTIEPRSPWRASRRCPCWRSAVPRASSHRSRPRCSARSPTRFASARFRVAGIGSPKRTLTLCSESCAGFSIEHPTVVIARKPGVSPVERSTENA